MNLAPLGHCNVKLHGRNCHYFLLTLATSFELTISHFYISVNVLNEPKMSICHGLYKVLEFKFLQQKICFKYQGQQLASPLIHQIDLKQLIVENYTTASC